MSKLRPTKSQAIKIVTDQSQLLLEVFRDFQASNGGWLLFPAKLLKMKTNLKADNYVLLYEEEKRLGISLCFIEGSPQTTLEIIMWNTPAATEMRFGFEVTMYVMNN